MFELRSAGGRSGPDDQDPLDRELRVVRIEALKAKTQLYKEKAKYYEEKAKCCVNQQEEVAARCSFIDGLAVAVGLWCGKMISSVFVKAKDGGWEVDPELSPLYRAREIAQAKADVVRAKFSEEKGKNGGYRGPRRDSRRPPTQPANQEVPLASMRCNGNGGSVPKHLINDLQASSEKTQ